MYQIQTRRLHSRSCSHFCTGHSAQRDSEPPRVVRRVDYLSPDTAAGLACRWSHSDSDSAGGMLPSAADGANRHPSPLRDGHARSLIGRPGSTPVLRTLVPHDRSHGATVSTTNRSAVTRSCAVQRLPSPPPLRELCHLSGRMSSGYALRTRSSRDLSQALACDPSP